LKPGVDFPARARSGQLKNFTGIDSEYQVPEAPELRLLTAELRAGDCVALVLQQLGQAG